MTAITYAQVSECVWDIRHTFKKLLELHDHESVSLGDDDDTMLEIIGATFTADKPFILGKPDIDYIVRETNWYDSQSLRVADISEPVPPIWKTIADSDGEVNSNYGFLVYNTGNGSQYLNVLNELKREQSTRRAVMIYTRPFMHMGATENGGNDFICTNTVQYLIREDRAGIRRLYTVVQMRSNDAVFGYRNDYAWQEVVRTRLLRDLRATYPDLRLGEMTWHVGSLHIYPRHIPLLREAIGNEDWGISTK